MDSREGWGASYNEVPSRGLSHYLHLPYALVLVYRLLEKLLNQREQ